MLIIRANKLDESNSTSLLAWGENGNQQLGIGPYTKEYEVEPKQIKITKHVSKLALGKDFCIIVDGTYIRKTN